ncbi:hypothetical protein EQG41_01910 [Billgrantia azerbaijanica]|nr:hypothetical protein EQG41_01910 [Halomonas azerbaijanica]
MPTPITTPARLVLSLDELLALADAHERAEQARYRRLAFGFLTFDTTTSRLMASLGIECERRLQDLRRIATEHATTPACRDAARHRPVERRAIIGFVGDHGMALDTLRQALADADYSQRFYAQLRTASAVPELHARLTAIIDQKRSELAVLQEHLASRDPLAEGRYHAAAG